MGAKKPLKLLSSSLVKLDFAIEEILLELSAMMATNNTKELRELSEKYEKLSNKADKLRGRAEQLIKDNSKKKSIVKKSSDTTFVDHVDFTDINELKTDNNICELPAEAVLNRTNMCCAYITITKNRTFILKKGSVLCKSDMSLVKKLKSSETISTRQKIMSDKTYAKRFIPTGYNKEKLVLKKDISVESAKALMEIIYGRTLLPRESIKDIKVHNKGLDIYLKTGNFN